MRHIRNRIVLTIYKISKKILWSCVILIIILIAFRPILAEEIYNKRNSIERDTDLINEEERCYGILVPLPRGKNLPHNGIQQGICNLINDLLRMNITVYWAAQNFTVLSIKTADNSLSNKLFERGTFIIPFTGDLSTDVLIASIVRDYEAKSEIEAFFPVEVFHIMEPVLLDVFSLNYPKIACNFGLNVAHLDLFFYLDILRLGGFLDYQLLVDDEIDERLNHFDFNIFIWPGGFTDLATSFKTSVNLRSCNAIRNFVYSGGGFIGSCYGAGAASSGMIFPINFFQSRTIYLPALGFLSLTSSSFIPVVCGGFTSVKLTNCSHPVSFGLDKIETTFHGGGPVFSPVFMDKNTQSLGVLDDLQIEWWEINIDHLPQSCIEKYIDCVIGKPLWISSKFGEGNVVVFGDHPEVNLPAKKDRIVHNTLFYTASGEKTSAELDDSYLLSEIKNVYAVTDDLNLSDYSSVFSELWTEIDLLTANCEKIDEFAARVFTHVFRICELGMNEGRLFKRTKYFHDSYQQWIEDFSQGLRKLERVYGTIKNVEALCSQVSEWRNNTVETLKNCYEYCNSVLHSLSIFVEKLEVYDGSAVQKSQLLNLFDELGVLYRKGYNLLAQPWSSIVSLYRSIWYMYECEQAVYIPLTHKMSELVFMDVRASLYGITCKDPRVIYVDDDALVGGNGSLEYPYQHIQDAIDVSNDGDTVFVKQGIYFERLVISKRVILIGEDKNTTIIDGNNRPHHLIIITQPYVEISGFTIQNTVKVYFSCGIVLYSSNVSVRGNIFKNNCVGLGANPNSSDNIIEGNIFVDNNLMGLGLDEDSQHNFSITKNVFENNSIFGLYTLNRYHIIKDNLFINNGISISLSTEPLNLEIINNTVNGKPLVCYKNCNDFEITNAGQIILSNCTNVTINDVNLSNADVGLLIFSSSNIAISHSHVAHTLGGIGLASSNDVTVLGNSICSNTWYGVCLYDSDRNQVVNNLLSENNGGIYLISSSNSSIESNSFTHSIIGLLSWDTSENNNICENNFMDNYKNGFDKCRNYWNANFWDDWIGLKNPLWRWIPYNVPPRVFVNVDCHPQIHPYGIFE